VLGDAAQRGLSLEQKARQLIENFRVAMKANPDSAQNCNNLAWAYLTAPLALRDVKAALPLAEKAAGLEPRNAVFGNTLGLAYYGMGRYRDAVEILRSNLAHQDDSNLAYDLYLLAMSHYQLGQTARAKDYYEWAARWTGTQKGLSADVREEL